jgi:hypothetical protein
MRIEPHAVVGKIILLGTLLFVGLQIYMAYFQHRLPDQTVYLGFFAILGSLGVWYVISPNLGLLGSLWESSWGKLFYGLGASVIVTVGKIAADHDIRVLTQSNPSLFPSAQQAITVHLPPAGSPTITFLGGFAGVDGAALMAKQAH